jgi:hypothetical protein
MKGEEKMQQPVEGDCMARLTRAKWMLGPVAAGLLASGVTVRPAVAELKAVVRCVWGTQAAAGELHGFLLRAIAGLEDMQARYPFMLYAHDWLAFAHIMLAVLFAGAIRDPVRNKWTVQCGLIMCACVPVLAGICVPIRGIPGWWFWVDFSFAPVAALLLWTAYRDIRCLEQKGRTAAATGETSM